MSARTFLTSGLAGLMLASAAGAESRPCPLPCLPAPPVQVPPGYCPPPPGYLPGVVPSRPPTEEPKEPKAPDTTVPPELPPETGLAVGEPTATFAQVPEAGAQPAASFNPMMFGDQGPLGTFTPPLIATLPNGTQIALRPGQSLTLPAGTVLSRPVTLLQQTLPGGLPPGSVIPAGVPLPTDVDVTAADVLIPVNNLPVNVIRGAYKIMENEPARPMDRVYFSYNYYPNVNRSLNSPFVAGTTVHRYTLGLEKTFLDGDASVGLRVPYLQITGEPFIEKDTFGDLSVVLKLALINDPVRPDYAGDVFYGGNVLSAGLVVTAPTGGTNAFSGREPVVHPWVLQPWVGGLYNMGRWFTQGFSSVAVPTDDRDTTFFFNGVQLGWFAYRNYDSPRCLKMIAPIAEVQVNTPLNNRGAFHEPLGASDIVNLTGGTILGFGRRSVVNLAVSVPVTGPKPYDVEALAQVNFLY